MHDALMRSLKVGDRVLIPAVVKEIHATEDYCNVVLESSMKRRPDRQRDTIAAINSGVIFRQNHGDVNEFSSRWPTTDGTWPPPTYLRAASKEVLLRAISRLDGGSSLYEDGTWVSDIPQSDGPPPDPTATFFSSDSMIEELQRRRYAA